MVFATKEAGEEALGLIEGSDISMTRKAIGGDPIEVVVIGYALSLRLDEARRVQVELRAPA